MKLQEAIENQIDIVCDSANERDKVVEILCKNGYSLIDYATCEQLIISIMDEDNAEAMSYGDGNYQKIPASEFIESNS